eukprot:9055750-Ditylum_brightwellii.AAC.1
MGKVQDTYMLYEKAGDEYIGKLMTGLPVMSNWFAASHPQFTCLKSGDKEGTAFISYQKVLNATVGYVITALFPSLSLSLCRDFPHPAIDLASLCHNHQWLLVNVPEGTEVRCSPHFCLDELDLLSKEEKCLLPANDGVHYYLQCATDIPSCADDEQARRVKAAI